MNKKKSYRLYDERDILSLGIGNYYGIGHELIRTPYVLVIFQFHVINSCNLNSNSI